MSLEPGKIFAGKYRVERLLGAGGMGEVFAATHLELGELVALKVMIEDTATTDALARFQREGRAAARLKSEFIARVLDVGRDDGLPYIVLEHIDGKDLHEVASARKPLPIAEAATFIAQACEGVAEAHALGMVHRDLKLRNLFLTQRADGRPLVKILDFGVVKLSAPRSEDQLDQPSLTLTQADTLIGSLPYMAPEQIQMSSKVDARADVWSLGVCLYELLAGERPFQGETVAEVIMAITRRPLPELREIRPDVPRDLADAVERALEKSLHRRYASVAELAAALAFHAGDPTLGDRVKAVLARGAKGTRTQSEPNLVQPTAEPDMALAPTRNWGPEARGAPAAPGIDSDATTRPQVRPPYADAPPPNVAPAVVAPPYVAPPVAVPVDAAPLGGTPRGAAPLPSPSTKAPFPPIAAAVAIGALVALALLFGWTRMRANPGPVTSASAATSVGLTSSSPDDPTEPPANLPSIASAMPTAVAPAAASSQGKVKTPGVTARPHPRPGHSGTAPRGSSDPYDKF